MIAEGRARVSRLPPRAIARFLVVVFVALSQCGCAQSPKLPVVEGYFVSESGEKSPRFSLEVCVSDAQRTLGLMYRKELPAKSGMLFIFPEESEHSFWMKNTYLTLDMVFVDKNRKVVGILSNVPPLNEVSRSVGVPSLYVVEFRGGTMAAHGISPGARLEFLDQLPSAK